MRSPGYYFAVAAAVFFLALPVTAAATTWRSQEGLVPAAVLEKLAERYPDIRTPGELSNLLIDIGRRVQTLSLEVRLEGGVWVIHGAGATLVSDINISMRTRQMTVPATAAVQVYLGQVDAPETRAKVVRTLERYMQRHGYPTAKVRLSARPPDNEGVTYDIDVTEGEPCTIAKIDLPFKLPRFFKLDVQTSDLCDLDTIETAVSTLETKLRDSGYSQVHLELATISYHPDTFNATLHIGGALGEKVRYEIVDSTHRFIIDDLFTNEDLRKIDPTIVSPDAMTAELARRYRNRGYLDVAIDGPTTEKVSDGEIVYAFHVNPGRQYVLKSIRFEGAKVFSDKEMMSTMNLESLWQTAVPYNYEDLQKGLAALKARYEEEGYWDVKIRDPGFGQKDKDAGTVSLTVAITEGEARRLRSLTVTGNKAMTYDEVAEMFAVKVGEPVDRTKLVDFQQQLRTAYIAKGYLYNDVQIDLKASEDHRVQEIDAHVAISEGVRVKIGDINIVGLTRTHDKVVRRELLVQRGDWYDPDRITASRQALTRLGIFRSVLIVPADREAVNDKEREIDLMVDVREGRPGNVSFGPGWSLLKGWNYGAEASYNNIGGFGRQASIRGAVSEEHDQYAIGARTLIGRNLGAGYTEPFIFDLPIDASIRVKQEAFWDGELWEISDGGELEFKYKFRLLLPGSYVSVFYGQKIAKTEGSVVQLDQLVASDERIGSLGTRFSIDRRDNLKFPTGGYTFDTELSWARYELNGDVRYFKWDVGVSKYFRLMQNLTLAFGVNATSYEDIQRKGNRIGILPPQERLQSGGDTVRGFPAGSLGPLVRGPTFENCLDNYSTTPLNGTSRLTIKTEVRKRLSEMWAVTGFVDNGNVFLSKDQMDKFQQTYNGPVTDPRGKCPKLSGQRTVEDNFAYNYADLIRNPGYLWTRNYYSYGGSVNALTPIGAFNLTYGLPWREPRSEGCRNQTEPCNLRAKQRGFWLRRGEFLVTVGARF